MHSAVEVHRAMREEQEVQQPSLRSPKHCRAPTLMGRFKYFSNAERSTWGKRQFLNILSSWCVWTRALLRSCPVRRDVA
jgi:hypothetical protein